MDLYAALGLKRDAPPEAVRRAYRKAAKAAHPDVPGGSQEKFAEVSTALAVLSDPRRRKTYDETGKVDEAKPDNEEAEALQLVMQQVEHVIAKAESYNIPIEHVDVVKDAMTSMRQMSADLDGEIRKAQDRVRKTRALAKRFKSLPGKPNRIGPMMEAKAAGIENGIAQAQYRRRIGEMAIAILGTHSFEWSA